MSAAVDEPCPNELVNLSEEIPCCDDLEELLYVVRLESWLGTSAENEPYLLTTAISEDDLKKLGRSVSTLRLRLTPPKEIGRRAAALNREPKWEGDPLTAIAVVRDLRAIKDKVERREICVFAEPTTDVQDKLGACPSHAGVKRSCPPKETDSRMTWAVLRKQVALCFDKFVNVKSGYGIPEDSA